MGQVKGNWLTGAHSGLACRHDDIYTKVDAKTGKCYSVKLCNPSDVVTEKQLTQRSTFGILASALSAWIKTEKEKMSADYVKVKVKNRSYEDFLSDSRFINPADCRRLLLPPIGVIDGSVLTAVGELFAFATLAQVPALIEATRNGRSIKLTKGNFDIDYRPIRFTNPSS